MISLYQQKWFFLLREQRTMSKRLIEWFCPTFFLKKKVYNLNERSQVAVFNLSPAAISQHRKKFSRTLLFPQSTGDFPVYNLAKNNDFSRHRMVSSVTDSLLTQHFSFHPFPPPSSDAPIMGVRGNVLKWKKATAARLDHIFVHTSEMLIELVIPVLSIVWKEKWI